MSVSARIPYLIHDSALIGGNEGRSAPDPAPGVAEARFCVPLRHSTAQNASYAPFWRDGYRRECYRPDRWTHRSSRYPTIPVKNTGIGEETDLPAGLGSVVLMCASPAQGETSS